jgi:hypothetical protein
MRGGEPTWHSIRDSAAGDIQVKCKYFVAVPYTFMTDVYLFALEGYNRGGHEPAPRDEFDQLYEETASRRCLMLTQWLTEFNTASFLFF